MSKVQIFRTGFLASATACMGLVSLILSASSCSSDPKPDVVEDFNFTDGGSRPTVEAVTINQKAAVIGAGANLTDALRSRFSEFTEPEKAKIILIDNEDIEKYSEDLYTCYNRGQLIIVLHPDGTTLSKWAEGNGVSQAFDGDLSGGNPCEIYGFNNVGKYYFLDDFKHVSLDDGDVPLNSFSTWVNRVTTPSFMSNDPFSYNIQRRFRPQEVSHTFSVALTTDQLTEKGWHFGDALSKRASVDIVYKIYPMYAFPGSNVTGDIYVVEAETTVHSGLMNNGSWTYKVNGNPLVSNGFYLSTCRVNNTIDDNASLLVTPAPELTTDGRTYDGGIELGFDATLTGGANDKLNKGRIDSGSWTWNNHKERELQGVTIVNLSDKSKVSFDCNIGGLPVSNKSYTVGLPAVATGDMTFYSTWVWNIQIAENSAKTHSVTVGIEPVYAGYTRGTLANDIKVTEFEPATNATPDGSFTFRLIAPERTKPAD
ncbi:MAG: hypothetical protein K2K84_07710 [Muribaculaceae bacterium]|nr:hypothetical protein [Muribaculaceae bacterium]